MIQSDNHSKYPKTMLRLRKQQSPGPKILLDVKREQVGELAQKIKLLRGQYVDSQTFEKNATHLVADILKCNDKFLGACVRGLWVLPVKYIEDSYEAGIWLKEEDFDQKYEHNFLSLVSAARRWRWRISSCAEQPFTGLHVAVLLNSNSDDYTKLLIFGGAQVHKLALPLRATDSSLSQISYVFTDHSYKEHIRTLSEYGLICLHYTFIVDTIIKDKELDILDYMVKEDSAAGHFQLHSPSFATGQKSVRICNISQSNQSHIQTIKAMDGLCSIIDLTVDNETAVENPPLKTLKSKVSKVTQLPLISSSCVSYTTTGSVNISTKAGLSKVGKGYAHLKNVTNLCRKENALMESKDNVIAGSQRICNDRFDSLKSNIQKNTLKDLNDPAVIHQASISEREVSSSGTCHDGISLDTWKLKTQHSLPGSTEELITFGEESYKETCVLSSSIRQPVQQTTGEKLEGEDSKQKSSSVNNRLLHIGGLRYKLNPSIYLSTDSDNTLCSATSSTHATEDNTCLQDKHEKTVKEKTVKETNTGSHSASGLKKEANKRNGQHPVINVCLLQPKLDTTGEPNTDRGDSSLDSLPLVQVNIRVNDCNSHVQQTPHVVINAEGLSQTGKSIGSQILWESTGVSSQEVDGDILWESTGVSSQEVDGDILWENSGVSSQDSSILVVSDSDTQTAAHDALAHSETNTRMSLKSESTSGRQASKDSSGKSSSRQYNGDKISSTSSRHYNGDKTSSTSSRQYNGDKLGSFRQGNTDKLQSTSVGRDNENRHRSLFNDVIHVGEDGADTRMSPKSEMTFKRQGSEDKSASVCGREDNEDKNRCLFTDIICINDDDDDDLPNNRLPPKSGSTSCRQADEQKSGSVCGRLDSEDKNGGTFCRCGSEDKHRSLFDDIMCDVDNSGGDDDDGVVVTRMPCTFERRQDEENKSGNVCDSEENKDKDRSCSPYIIYIDDDDDDVANTRIPYRSESISDPQASENKSLNLCKDKDTSTSDRQDSAGRQRSLFNDLMCLDDKPSQVMKSEPSSVSPPLSSTQPSVIMDRFRLSESSAEASRPGITSTPKKLKFSPGKQKQALSPRNRRLSQASLLTKGKSFQPNLQRFGFSSVCKKSIDGDIKEGLSFNKAALASGSVKGTGKPKKSASGVEQAGLRSHTLRGPAKRRTLNTTLPSTEITVDECPEWTSGCKEESSMAVKRIQSNTNDTIRSTSGDCIKMIEPSVQFGSSDTESLQKTKRTQRGLAKRRRELDTILSDPAEKECPARRGNTDADCSMAAEYALNDDNGYITVNNPSLQSQLSRTGSSHQTATHTQQGPAKRRAVDNNSVLLSESQAAITPSRSASCDSVTSPAVGETVADVYRRNSVPGSKIKNPHVHMKRPFCKYLSWDMKFSSQTIQTQQGLARQKATFLQIQDTAQSSCSWCPTGRHEHNVICAAANGVQGITRDDSECDSSTNNLHIKTVHPLSQISSSWDQTTEGITHQAVISRATVGSTEDGTDSRQLQIQELTDSSPYTTDTRIAADSVSTVKSEKETLPIGNLEDLQNFAQENNITDRSLFESFCKIFGDTKFETKCSDDIEFKAVLESGPGSSSELTGDKPKISTVSRNSGDSEELKLFQKGNICNTTTTTDSLSADLPTPSKVICHDSGVEAAEASTTVCATYEAVGLPLDCNPSIAKDDMLNANQQQAPSEGRICNDEQLEPSTSIQSSDSYPIWPLTYLLSYHRDHSESQIFLPVIYGQWMESAREMGSLDQAISHARPTKSRLPTSLLLSELVHLARSTGGDVSPQAVTYLYTWLELHPPITPVTVRLYTEAFELSSESSVLFDTLRDVADDSKQRSAILLLEYFISVFEINFDFSLKSGEKSLLQKCIIVKWLWKDSYTIVRGRTISHLLEVFECIVKAPLLNCRAGNAVCALLSLACECLRLANVRWDYLNPKYVIDSVITLSHDIAKIIHSSYEIGNTSRTTVLNMLRPAWLKLLVAAKLLSYYNNYLLSDPLHVNTVSVNSIVTQFFLLVPPEASGESEAHNQEHSVGHTSKHLEETHDARKSKERKGILTAEKVNKRNGKGESAIHIACMRNKSVDLARLLQVPGADVNLRDNNGWTPLHEACHHGNLACVELLLKHAPRAQGSASAGHQQISGKVEIDAPGPDGLTPLHDAVCQNKIDVCKLLLKFGGKKLLKTTTHYNLTALDLARSDKMKAFLNGSSDESSVFDLSISQDVDDPSSISDAVKDIAPLTQRYREVTGIDCGHMASLSSCKEFLMLLTALVSSYYKIFRSMEESGLLDSLEKDVLESMEEHLMLFRRHLRKLTRPEDFEKLQFRLHCFETLCLNKTANVYL